MNKKGNIKNIIIVVLCVTIIAMAIGFTVLSMRLEKYRSEEEVFDVRFTSFRLVSSIKGGKKNPEADFKIDRTGKILSIKYHLWQEHDEVDYEVTIKNEGSIGASIVQLFSSPDFQSKETRQAISPVIISISDISGKLLEPGEETTVKISAIYNSVPASMVAKPMDVSGKIGVIAASKK